MQSESQRKGYLMRSLGMDTPILNRLVFNQSVDDFITDMLCELAAFGETDGKPALCTLLEEIREGVGLDKQLEIDNLLQQIQDEPLQSQDSKYQQSLKKEKTLSNSVESYISPEIKIVLKELKNQFSRFQKSDFKDEDKSILIISRLFTKVYSSDEIDISNILIDNFVSKKYIKIKSIVERYSDEISLESLLVFERLENNYFRLRDVWDELLSFSDLENLANIWGISID